MSGDKLRQSTAVAIAGRALLIEGPPGSGKTSLALALIDRGAQLIGDDGICLGTQHGRPVAKPPPTIHGQLEIRNVGIVDLPTCCAPVALILQITPDAPRYVEAAGHIDIAGYPVPILPFTVGNAADAIRAEYALRIHGLTRD